MNGAGKLTLVKLLAGLYQPTAGQVLADGVDIASMPAVVRQSRLSVVFQDFLRYELTLEENILLGQANPEVDPLLVRRAVEQAGLLERELVAKEVLEHHRQP